MVFGQEDTTVRNPGIIAFREEAIDSSLRIVDRRKANYDPYPAFYINGKFYPPSISLTRSWDFVTMRIVEEDTIVNGNVYKGKVYLTIPDDTLNIVTISLSDVKKKYTELKGEPVVFIIDGNIITRDYDTYLINENMLYTISFGKIQKQDIVFVDIVTKTEESIKKRNGFFAGARWEQ
jgi:hypothetical protein